MRPNPAFRKQPKSFWAHVRSISEEVGYTLRADKKKKTTSQIKTPTLLEMREALTRLGLDPSRVADDEGHATDTGSALHGYFVYRARVLNEEAQANLMSAEAAKLLFNETRRNGEHSCPLPLNKQKGDKKTHAYLTGLVNMLIEESVGEAPCSFDPRNLTTITSGGAPLRTLARRVDGAFPSNVNPVAIWEIKEYYYTTTFGSRVADGVYETLLDGMEIEELQQSEQIEVKHYLMIDGHRTWWRDGKSYLCRIVDMLHMGYVDEVLIGREVVAELPRLARSWMTILASRPANS